MTFHNLLKPTLLFCSVIFYPLLSLSQTRETMEEFARRREREMQSFANQQKNEMDSMLVAQNKAFEKMLSGKWTRADIFPEVKVYAKPKPLNPIVKLDVTADAPAPVVLNIPGGSRISEVKEQEVPNESEKGAQVDPSSQADIPKEAEPADEMKTEPKPEIEVAPEEQEKIKVDEMKGLELRELSFFGNATRIPNVKHWPRYASSEVGSGPITEYWKKCSEYDAHILLAYLAEQRKELHLNSWSSLKMIEEIARYNFSDAVNEELFIWYMMIQLGYDVRLFYGDKNVYAAAAFDTKIYSQPYLEISGKRYYFLSKREGSHYYTYSGEHSNAVVKMNFKTIDSGVYPQEWKQRTIKFPYRHNDFSVTIPYNVHRSDFYVTVPQNDFDSYFSNPGGESFRERLAQSLGPDLSSLEHNDDRIRFLHAMVCLGVEYETDAQQFGYEKYCMPEEFLSYPKADCEDRTFFLNYLYRNILGVPTIGLVYPGHMAMAVAMENPPTNAAIIHYKDKDYVYCDPTYIGAEVGDMPQQYQGVTPEIVE
jgi:hypothetical protein